MQINSQYSDKICNLFSQKDCNDILESKASKLFDFIGWSEIGFGFFASNLFILIFTPNLIICLALLNLLTIPYSFWSIWYQKFKAKQWCPLCVIIQCIFWCTLVVNIYNNFLFINNVNIKDLIFTFSTTGFFILLSNKYCSKISESSKVEHIKQELNSIKANEEVFKVIIKNQTRYKVDLSYSKIIFGNLKKGNLFITIFTNPFCNPCAKLHTRVEKILLNSNNITIQYIFSSFDVNLNYANKYLISNYLENKSDIAQRIFYQWFTEEKKLNIKKEDLKIASTNEVEKEFGMHEKWKSETKLRSTPTILVNGYVLPDNYKIEDLIYFTQLNF